MSRPPRTNQQSRDRRRAVPAARGDAQRIQKRKEGLRTKGRVLTYGVIPPAAGIHRVRWCIDEGLAQLQAGSRKLGLAYTYLIEVYPRGILSLPGYYPLHMPAVAPDAVGADRRRQWRTAQTIARLPNSVAALTIALDSSPSPHQPPRLARAARPAWASADRAARAAESDLTTAFNCLHEAGREATDVTDDALSTLAPDHSAAITRAVIESYENRAHELAHRAAELVSGLFGCTIVYDEGAWMDRCRLEMMHSGLGLSAGFTARHVCSVCSADLAVCEHLPGVTYTVEAARHARDEGDTTICSICAAAVCEHVDGDRYPVVASPRICDAVMHEVSVTPRPRDPRSRIEEREIAQAELETLLGRSPHPGDVISRTSCMAPCAGFTTPKFAIPKAPTPNT